MVEEAGGVNGKVDLTKMGEFARRKFKKPEDLDKEMRLALRALDKEGRGTIMEAELRQILTTLGDTLNNREVPLTFLSPCPLLLSLSLPAGTLFFQALSPLSPLFLFFFSVFGSL